MRLFLSHSGSDSEAAIELKKRILASPTARDAGLDVWLDVDGDLKAGREWQEQLEEAIGSVTAFCVYIGSNGVVNWVDREVRLGLSRATGENSIPFIPIRASQDIDWDALPPFARQFHGVTDPLKDNDALEQLISAALSQPDRRAVLTDEPFVGLRAMGEAEADRFFGRGEEIGQLSALVQAHRLVAVVADSGAGKSSLVRAGLIPAFRGGMLADDQHQSPQGVRHPVVMRPGADPLQGLRDGIDKAARGFDLGISERRALRKIVDLDDPGETAYALRCELDQDTTEVLLVVDQFEELLTTAEPDVAKKFADLLLALTDPKSGHNVRVVLTVRADYYNLIRRHDGLFDRLEADDGAAQLRLKRISDDGLAEVVHEPLKMAGNQDEEERAALLEAVLRDTPERPGDLALVQMALFATWRRAQQESIGLVRAYAEVHGVLGALAFEAERTRTTLLDDAERALLVPLFARLVRLGDTGGATRRIASLSDLNDARATLARKLASEEAGRLLMVGEDTVEIAHEALVAQWPWLQSQIQECAEDIRTLVRLGDQAVEWQASGRKGRTLPNESERQAFKGLSTRRAEFLSPQEAALISAATRRRTLLRFAAVAAFFALAGSGISSAIFGVVAISARDQADEEARSARRNASSALAALARVELESTPGGFASAAKLALAAWPRSLDPGVFKIDDVIGVLREVTPRLRPRAREETRGQFSPNSNFLIVLKESFVEIYDKNSGIITDEIQVNPYSESYDISPSGNFIAISRESGPPWLWNVKKSRIVPEISENPEIYSSIVSFTPDGKYLLANIEEGELAFWDLENFQSTSVIAIENGYDLSHAVVSSDQELLALASREGTVQLLDLPSGTVRTQLEESFNWLQWIAFFPNPRTIATLDNQEEGRLQFWNAEDGTEISVGEFTSKADLVDELASSYIEFAQIQDSVLLVSLQTDEIWGLIADEEKPKEFYFRDSTGIPTAFDVTPGKDRLITFGWDGLLRLWDINQAHEVSQLDVPLKTVVDVAFGDNRHVLVGTYEGDVFEYDLAENPTVTWHELDSLWQAVSPDGSHVAVLTDDGGVTINETLTNEVIIQLSFDQLGIERSGQGPSGHIQGVGLSADGQRLAVVSNLGSVNLVDLSDSQVTKLPLTNHELQKLHSDVIAFSPDGRYLVIGGGDQSRGGAASIVVWDTDTQQIIVDQRERTAAPLTEATFIPDESQLIATFKPVLSSDDLYHVMIDLTDPQLPSKTALLPRQQGDLGRGRSFVVSADGQRVIAGGGTIQGVLVFDVATNTTVAQFHELGAQTIPIGFASDSSKLVILQPEMGRLGFMNLSNLPDGSLFDVVCEWLPDTSLDNVIENYPISIDFEICDEGYDPPLPDWAPSHFWEPAAQ